MLDVSESTLRRMIHDGRLECVRLGPDGRSDRISVESIERLVRAMPVFKRGRYWYIRFQSGGVEYKRSTGCTESGRPGVEDGGAQPLRRAFPSRTYGDALERYRPPESMRSHTRNTWELASLPLTSLVAGAHEMRDRMLDEGYSPFTINRRLSVVRRILNICYREWDWIQQPLGQKIRLLSEKGLERQVSLTRGG